MNPLLPLGQEWTTLQNNHEQYERSSLLIKLAAVFFSLLGLMFDFPALYLVAMLLILWLMEGIFRTSQARLGTLGLIGEYLANAARPTVAFPYAVLVILSAFL